MTDRTIYHLAAQADWAAAQASGIYRGSPDDARDGFMHFSTASQVAESAARHRGGRADQLLLAVPTEGLGDALRWETSRGGAPFPHLYAPLRVDQVSAATPLALGPDGRHVFPDLTR